MLFLRSPGRELVLKRAYLAGFERGHAFASLDDAKIAAESCKNCPLLKRAIQTVFGEGPARAAVMLIGEQPGDYEDVKGRPSVDLG